MGRQPSGNLPLPVAAADDADEPRVLPFPSGEVKCRERLGGLLKYDTSKRPHLAHSQ